jgi:hypothetical protein
MEEGERDERSDRHSSVHSRDRHYYHRRDYDDRRDYERRYERHDRRYYDYYDRRDYYDYERSRYDDYRRDYRYERDYRDHREPRDHRRIEYRDHRDSREYREGRDSRDSHREKYYYEEKRHFEREEPPKEPEKKIPETPVKEVVQKPSLFEKEEKEIERFTKEVARLRQEEYSQSAALRKISFEADMINWQVNKWETQLELINQQLNTVN